MCTLCMHAHRLQKLAPHLLNPISMQYLHTEQCCIALNNYLSSNLFCSIVFKLTKFLHLLQFPMNCHRKLLINFLGSRIDQWSSFPSADCKPWQNNECKHACFWLPTCVVKRLRKKYAHFIKHASPAFYLMQVMVKLAYNE